MPKAIPLEEQYWYYLTHNWEDKGVHTFPKAIFSKVNVIARLEYELAYYDSAAHRFNHYTMRTPHCLNNGSQLVVINLRNTHVTHVSFKVIIFVAKIMEWILSWIFVEVPLGQTPNWYYEQFLLFDASF